MFTRFKNLSKRSKVIGAAGLAVVLAAGTTAYLVLGDGVSDPLGAREGDVNEAGGAEGNAAEAFEGGEPLLLYASYSSTGEATLIRRGAIEQEEEVSEPLPAQQLSASQASGMIAYVASEPVEGETNEAQPILRLRDPFGEEAIEVGVGLAPVWNATGDRLAFLRPTDVGDCVGGTQCRGGLELFVLDPATGEELKVLGRGRWMPLGWAGDRLLVAAEDQPDRTGLVSLEGDVTSLDVPWGEIVSASPDGRWVLRRGQDDASLIELDEGRAAGQPVEVPLDGRFLYSASWAHDSSRLAAVVGLPPQEDSEEEPRRSGKKGKGKKGGPAPQPGASPSPLIPSNEVAIFTPEDPADQRIVEQSGGALALAPVWSVANDHVVFARVVGEDANQQTFYCPVVSEGSCRLMFTFTVPVQLLRME